MPTGKQMLDYEAKRQAVNLPSLLKNEYVEPILRKFSFADLDDLYAAVGCGGIAAQQVVTRRAKNSARTTNRLYRFCRVWLNRLSRSTEARAHLRKTWA